MLIKLSNLFSYRKQHAEQRPSLAPSVADAGQIDTSSGSRLQSVRELEQGLLAVDDIQVVDVGLQLLLLLWRHVTSYFSEGK